MDTISSNHGAGHFEDVSVVMATLNEEKAVGKVISDIRAVTHDEAEIVVVDGSSDKTAEIAAGLGAKVISQAPQGYGVAMKRAVLSAGRDIIVTLDCDDTYPAGMIPVMVDLIHEGYDVVSGSRMAECEVSMSWLNRKGNWFFAWLTSLLYNISVTDVTTGMRAYRRAVIQNIDWTENVGLSAEFLFRPAAKGYRIKEIAIPYRARIGETKLNPYSGGAGILKSILKYRLIDR
jgi:glycosyltransferase involved in cell wall biosynthesis